MKKTLIIGILIIGLVMLTACSSTNTNIELKEGDPIIKVGEPTLTITEYSDFECPFCGRFARETFPQIKENYIDTGKIAFEFKDYPLPFHRYAQGAAQAAECAYQQGKFEEYHDRLYENQEALSKRKLEEYAEEVGLNMDAFETCYSSQSVKDKINANIAEGQLKGVTGTPAFFLSDGTKIEGAQPYSVFANAIDEALEN